MSKVEYKRRGLIAEGRNSARKELTRRDGGPLGITSLREIILGVKSLKEASQKWGRLFGSSGPWVANLFAFDHGPKIRLVEAKAEGIRGIIVRVKSNARAKKFLMEKQMLGRSDAGEIWIAPTTVGGLRIELVED